MLVFFNQCAWNMIFLSTNEHLLLYFQTKYLLREQFYEKKQYIDSRNINNHNYK